MAEALDDIDVVVPVLDATGAIGPGDRLVLERAAATCRGHGRRPGPTGALSRLLVVVNKVDRASQGARSSSASTGAHARPRGGGRRTPGCEYFPVSAVSGQGVDALVDAVLARLPGAALLPRRTW